MDWYKWNVKLHHFSKEMIDALRMNKVFTSKIKIYFRAFKKITVLKHKMKIAITYSIVNGGAAKGFLEFLMSRENINEVRIISADWAQSHQNFIKSKINALVSKSIQQLILKRYVKCSLNIWPIIDLSSLATVKYI